MAVRKCKENNAKVFKDAVERTAAIELKANADLAKYNANLKKLQHDYNEHLGEFHQRNLALLALVQETQS